MRRNLEKIYSLLTRALANESATGMPSVYATENADENNDSHMRAIYFTEMLVKSGFLRQVNPQADFDNLVLLRLTWKGHCFLDLFDVFTSSPEDSPRRVAAEMSLLSLC